MAGATLQAMEVPAVRDRLQGLGAMLVTPDRRSPDYLARFVESEIRKWAEPIRSSGVSVE
jgi:hypothetical protein